MKGWFLLLWDGMEDVGFGFFDSLFLWGLDLIFKGKRMCEGDIFDRECGGWGRNKKCEMSDGFLSDLFLV
jgi:hypothetical protein